MSNYFIFALVFHRILDFKRGCMSMQTLFLCLHITILSFISPFFITFTLHFQFI